jgi:hypothetical protein
MEAYKQFSILYWYGYVAPNGDLSFCLMFKGEEEKVNGREGYNALDGAQSLCYPTICLN